MVEPVVVKKRSHKKMTPCQRVEKEMENLNIKILGLSSFFNTIEFAKLSKGNRKLLKKQYKYMNKYAAILEKRIKNWEEIS